MGNKYTAKILVGASQNWASRELYLLSASSKIRCLLVVPSPQQLLNDLEAP